MAQLRATSTRTRPHTHQNAHVSGVGPTGATRATHGIRCGTQLTCTCLMLRTAALTPHSELQTGERVLLLDAAPGCDKAVRCCYCWLEPAVISCCEKMGIYPGAASHVGLAAWSSLRILPHKLRRRGVGNLLACGLLFGASWPSPRHCGEDRGTVAQVTNTRALARHLDITPRCPAQGSGI